MRRFLLGRKIGMALVGSLLVVGCRQLPKRNDSSTQMQARAPVAHTTCCCRAPARLEPVAVMSAPIEQEQVQVIPAEQIQEAPKPVATLPKVDDRDNEEVLVPVTAPASLTGDPGSITGTMRMTGAEARALGIRPGQPTGVVFLPASYQDSQVQPVSSTQADTTPDSQVPSASVPEER
jgi:hypothetical protein